MAYPMRSVANDDDDIEAPSQGDDEALVNYAKRCFQTVQRSKIGIWREEAEEDYNFVAGEQWDESDKAALRDQLRVPITFNRVGTIIDSVAGYEVNNRQEVRYFPRKLGDSPINEVLTGAAKWFRDECDAEDEESDSFFDMAVCGMGWTETRMDYDDTPEGMPDIHRVDPLETFWDPTARKRNLGDARFVGRVCRMPRGDIEAMADPGVEIGGDGAPWKSWRDDDANNEPHDQEQAKFYRGNNPISAEDDQDELVVLQLQWKERGSIYRVLDPSQGRIITMPEDKYNEISKQAQRFGIQLRAQKLPQKLCKQVFICGEVVVTKGDCPDPMRFSLQCMTGKRDRNAGTWYGLVRAMKDPQRWANKWLTQLLHIMNANAKGGVMAETNAFEDPRQAEESWTDPSGITWVAPGALAGGRIQPKPQTQFSAGHMTLTEFAAASIRDVTGINVETLGLADRNQPGVLEAHRKQAAMTILAPMFDSLRRYRKEQGRVLLYLIQNVLSDGRLVRIEGPQMAQYVPLIHNDDVATYDVIVDDAPTSPNQKEQVFGVLATIMPMLLKAGVPIPPEALDYMPIPTSLTEKWKQMIQQHQQQPQQDPKMMAVQAQVAMGQQRMQIEAQQNQQKMQMDAQHQQMSMQADAADDQRRAQLEHQQVIQQMALDRQRAQQEIAIQHDKMRADIEESRMRAISDIQIAREKADSDAELARRRAAVTPQYSQNQ